ncbi:MAG: hypothetical protein ACE5JQ_16645, partial [Candidatus Methylomirabilales bacterium]
MGKLWERLIAGFKRPMKGLESPPRRSPWVMVGHLPTDPGLTCTFCGRERADVTGASEREDDFVLVQARHNPRLQHIVCSECVKWN